MAANNRIALIAITSSVIGLSMGGHDSSAQHRATDKPDVISPPAESTEAATFAGGCFWCMEPPFEKLSGVIKVESGYTGGFVDNPTYQQVSHTETGHVEAVRVTFDSTQIRYEDLLEVFWRNIDPTDDGGQFNDRGTSYVTAIFVQDEQQRLAAEASKKRLGDSGRFKKPIVTPIRDAKEFFLAEDYHQDYYKKSSLKYNFYRFRSGRDAFLDRVWGTDRQYTPPPIAATTGSDDGDTARETQAYEKPSRAEIRKKLSRMQYKVTQEDATEPAFKNRYWDNKSPGIYVDVVSGEPLFSSLDKFESGTGWPSFTRPLVSENIVTRTDYKMIFPRTEVRSKHGDSHLGHVFDDGPAPTGLRYCMNSAALRFVPAKKLKDEGYGEFLDLFQP